MILYVAGPMTGLPQFNYPAFNAAEKQLRAVGFEVFNPVNGEAPPTPGEERTWAWYLRRALRQVVSADGIATLPGWADSKGARLEVHVAVELGMPVHSVETWTLATADVITV